MTILEVLAEDHQEVSEKLKLISRTRSAKSREKHFVEMKQSLEMHAFLEQLIFYRAMLDLPENRDRIEHAEHEHQQITDALAELDSLSKDDEAWMSKFKTVKDLVDAHVKEEEGEVFDRARKTMSPERLASLGAEMVTKKAEQLAVQ